MWIALGIVLGLTVLIITVLLLPVHLKIKNDGDNHIDIRVKILCFRFGGKSKASDKKEENSFLKMIKNSAGLSKIGGQKAANGKEKDSLLAMVTDTCRVLFSLLQELIDLLGKCRFRRFKLTIICTGKDAADAAISYGQCCAVAYPLIGLLTSRTKVSERGRDIHIACDYADKEGVFLFDIVVAVKVYQVLWAFLRVALKEAKRSEGV